MAGGGALRCELVCAAEGYGETHQTEFTYALKEAVDSDEEEQKMEVDEGPDMIHLTVQCICPLKIFQLDQQEISINLLRKGDKLECDFELEKVDNPAEDIKLKALLRLTNGKVFDIIQKL